MYWERRLHAWRNPPRDPIVTPFIAGLVFDAGITGFGAVSSLSIFGISAATIATGALVVGANYALSAINKPKAGGAATGGIGAASTVNTPEVRGNIQQSAPIERWVYGRVRTGGAVFFLDDSKPPYLYLGLMLSGRQISAVRGVRLSTNDIAFGSFGFDQVLTPLAVTGQSYVLGGTSRLFFSFGAGTENQAMDVQLAADFPSLDRNFRLQGIATAVCKFAYGNSAADFTATWGQGTSVPSPQFELDGAPVYDPRDPSQRYPIDWRDAEDVADAMRTWKFRRNAALIQADWGGHPDGCAYPPGRIRWDKVADSADFDDEPIENKDGTSRPRHQIDGVVTLDQSPRTNMEAMLTANRGFWVTDRGRGWVQSSQPRTPVATINDDLIMSSGFEFQCDRAKRDLVNSVTSRFSSADRQYQDTDGPVLKREDLIEADGEEIPRAVRLPFTSVHQAAQVLEQQFLAEARLPRSITMTVKLRAIADALTHGACVQVWSEVYPQMNGLYTVESMGFLDDFSGLPLSLKEYDPTIPLNWNAVTDEQDFTLPALTVS